MKIIFFLVHPAHYHLFKNVMRQLREKKHEIQILIIKKDVLETLLINDNWEYYNIMPKGRKFSHFPVLLSSLLGLAITCFTLTLFSLKNRPDIFVGTEYSIVYTGKILNIPSIIVNEDDTNATPENYLVYPFAKHLLIPECCDIGKWCNKKINYNGYHELAYLHPKYFIPDKSIIKSFNPSYERYFIIRLVELTASHDVGKKGLDREILKRVIEKLEQHGRVFITAEKNLDPIFEKYRIKINPLNIFDVLYYADLVIGDSQTMIAESAVLGTPSIRFNDFVGKLGYLEELEHRYDLTYGISTTKPEDLLKTIDRLLKMENIKETWREKRSRLLSEKIDVTEFMTDLIHNYPESCKRLKNPKL
jgi:predicted glycosyltransferase